MTYYTSPNDRPEYNAPWHWTVTGFDHEDGLPNSTIDVEFGYGSDSQNETLTVSGSITNESEAYAAVLNLPDYVNSTGPITGGGLPDPD